jgi:hypothetical protein
MSMLLASAAVMLFVDEKNMVIMKARLETSVKRKNLFPGAFLAGQRCGS